MHEFYSEITFSKCFKDFVQHQSVYFYESLHEFPKEISYDLCTVLLEYLFFSQEMFTKIIYSVSTRILSRIHIRGPPLIFSSSFLLVFYLNYDRNYLQDIFKQTFHA